MEFSTLKYLKFSGLLLSLLLGCGFLEAFLLTSSLPRGIFVCAFEFCIELLACFFILNVKQSIIGRTYKNCLSLFFVFLGFADLAYFLHYYVKALPNNSWIAIVLTSIPYSLAYIAAGVAMVSSGKEGLRLYFGRGIVSLLPFAISLPVLCKILIPAMIISFQQKGMNLFLAGRIANSFASLFLLHTSIVVLIRARNLAWSLFSVGCASLILANWALGAEVLFGKTIAFGFYEFFWAGGVALCALPVIATKGDFAILRLESASSVMVQYRVTMIAVVSFALLLVSVTQPFTFSTFKVTSLGLALATLASVALSYLLIDQITRWSTKMGSIIEASHASMLPPEELALIPVEIRETYNLFFAKKAQEVRLRKDAEARLGMLATQVAHDIRSPLSALQAVLQGVKADLPEEKRMLLQAAAERMSDIANNLLDQDRAYKKGSNSSEVLSVCMISSLVEAVLSEKRAQFQAQTKVRILRESPLGSYGLFVALDPVEFKRVLSNLVNNAVDSMNGNGIVGVSVFAKGDRIKVQVRDNGCGFSPDVLQKIGSAPVSYGKESGNGLGLFHASNAVKSWGGALEIQSKPGVGTSIFLNLPKVEAPHWFVPELRIKPGQQVVVLDDDQTIHHVWRSVFQEFRAKGLDLNVVHCTTTAEVRGLNPQNKEEALLLFDHELVGSAETGLSLLREIGPHKNRRILVTNRFEDRGIQEECTHWDIGLIPKVMASEVPVAILS